MRSEQRTILAITDDGAGGRLLRAVLEGGEYAVEMAEDTEALARARSRPFDAAVLDLHLSGLGGREMLRRLHAAIPGLPVVMLTSASEVNAGVECIRLGAFDYLTTPLRPDELLLRVGRAVEYATLGDEVRALRRLAGEDGGLAEAMGGSASVAALIEEVRRVAGTGLTVLLVGETGTGKEHVARAIHHLSPRRHGPFVAVDCGAIAEDLLEVELVGHERPAFTGALHRREGLLQVAAGGTLLLDEVDHLAPRLQAKLLRVLQERQVVQVGGTRPVDLDVRFLASTSGPLERAVAQDLFRRDLFFRLTEYTLTLPPLRDRLEDIPHLAARFLRECAGAPRELTLEALAELRQHRWPGNVRQLRNVVRQAAIAADGPLVQPVHMRLGVAGASGHGLDGRPLREIADTAVADAETVAIRRALHLAAGNRAEAARMLQVDYKTLYLKLKRYGIEA